MKKLILLVSFIFAMGMITVNAQDPKKPDPKGKTTQAVTKPAAKPAADAKAKPAADAKKPAATAKKTAAAAAKK